MTTSTLVIDPEFQVLLRPLSAHAKQQLEDNIKSEGCRDDLIVWEGRNILIDGHNRLEICERLNEPYSLQDRAFESREEVKLWIINNQLGKREVTLDDRDYYLGVKYQLTKKSEGRPEKRVQNAHVNPERTAEKIAKEHGVSPDTVKRAAKAVETVETQAVPEIQAAVTAGILPVRTAAKVATLPVEKQREVAAAPEPKQAANTLISDPGPFKPFYPHTHPTTHPPERNPGSGKLCTVGNRVSGIGNHIPANKVPSGGGSVAALPPPAYSPPRWVLPRASARASRQCQSIEGTKSPVQTVPRVCPLPRE